ncbi:MAG: tetratricopeptide repeat protein, partial [Phycisphaerales bacterium]|nr:tetratricopeptide repeat protein [Phycisphaerales bacterium]
MRSAYLAKPPGHTYHARMERNPTASPMSMTRLAMLAISILLIGCGDSPAPLDQATIDANNRAIGYMGRYEYTEAADIWEPLTAANPDWLDGQVNLAIATLNRQNEGDEDRALALLEAVIAQDTSNVRAQYLSGYLLVRAGRNDEAIDRFMAVVSLDPDDAYGWYHYGVANDEKEPATALLAYEGAVERNPYLRSGWYRLGQISARLGETEKASKALETFQKLEGNPRGTMVKPVYGRLGPNALAATIDTEPTTAAKPDGPVWLASAPLQAALGPWREDGGARIPTAVDFNGDGTVELFIAGAGTDPAPNAVILRDGDAYRVDREHPLATVPDVVFALFGDLDNDGNLDAYLGCDGPNVLFMQDDAGAW